MFEGWEINNNWEKSWERGWIDTNIWINVYCCNALQLKKTNPGSWVSCHLITFLKKSKKFMMTGCLKNSGEAWFGGYNDEEFLVSSVCAYHAIMKWRLCELPNQKKFITIKIILLNSLKWYNLVIYDIQTQNITHAIFVEHVHLTRLC